MKKEQTLYAITNEDVKNISDEMNISVLEKDIPFIEDKIGNFIGDTWREAIEYALWELEQSKNKEYGFV